MRILVVEDDPRLTRVLARGLREDGHQVEAASDGESGLDRLRHGGFDACILDVRLPKLDGLTALERARAAGVATPVVMLTARDAVPDRVRGLEAGADDYLIKPFAFAELSARLQAIVRRGAPKLAEPLRCGGVELDPAAHLVTVGEQRIELSAKQFVLLELLLRHRGHVVSRTMILESVFGYTFDPGTNLVDVHIKNLRQKLEVAGHSLRIHTVRGVGYRVEDDAAR